MNKELYIGVMSGTSLDGIDITLCEVNTTSLNLIHSQEYSFPKDLKENILNMIDSQITLKDLGELNTKLGNLYAFCINTFLKDFDINYKDVTAIGLHGQTLWHEPKSYYPFSMQLGDPNIVAAKTDIKVTSDFRNMDIANGGEGAPLTPAFHEFIFKDTKKKTAILNIGGIANITLLETPLKGWDTGVGNTLMDYWIQKSKGISYDKDGEFAKSGKIDEELLEKLLDDLYFKQHPPKSTGREYFNPTWLSSHFPLFQTNSDANIQRTLLEFTAQTISNDVILSGIELLIVCGGGAKNAYLMQRLKELNTCEVIRSDELGISSDFMESMAFAWLAYKRIHNEEVNIAHVTGAKKDSILGGIYG